MRKDATWARRQKFCLFLSLSMCVFYVSFIKVVLIIRSHESNPPWSSITLIFSGFMVLFLSVYIRAASRFVLFPWINNRGLRALDLPVYIYSTSLFRAINKFYYDPQLTYVLPKKEWCVMLKMTRTLGNRPVSIPTRCVFILVWWSHIQYCSFFFWTLLTGGTAHESIPCGGWPIPKKINYRARFFFPERAWTQPFACVYPFTDQLARPACLKAHLTPTTI